MDHEVVNISNSPASCGIVEISRMNEDIPKMIFAIANSFYHPARGNPPAFVMWSGLVTGFSDGLMASVLEKKLGDVTCSPAAQNPKTSNFIRVYLWRIDHEALKAYYKAERVDRARWVGAGGC